MTEEKLKALRTFIYLYFTEFDGGMNTYVTKAVGEELLTLIDEYVEYKVKLEEIKTESAKWRVETEGLAGYWQTTFNFFCRNIITIINRVGEQ